MPSKGRPSRVQKVACGVDGADGGPDGFRPDDKLKYFVILPLCCKKVTNL